MLHSLLFSLQHLPLLLRQTLKQRPVALMNSLSGCCLFASSDVLAQYMEYTTHRQQHGTHCMKNDTTFQMNYRRVWSTSALGILYTGFMYPRAYAILDHQWPQCTIPHVVIKSMVEIVTVGVFMNATSLTARGLLVGRPFRDVIPHVIYEMPRVTCNDARVWFPYNTVAFACIPANIRPTTTALVNATWQTYISLRSHDYS